MASNPKAEGAKGKGPAAGSVSPPWLFPVFAFLVVGAVMVQLVRLGAPLGPATFGLAAAAGVLLIALRRLFAVVQVLARSDLDVTVATQGRAGVTLAELRDEHWRVLKAIKELDFDHSMGKLSDEDHASLGRQYRLRAIEVMRELDGARDLHPEVRRALAEIDTPTQSGELPTLDAKAPVVTPKDGNDVATHLCPTCGGDNDPDARFCKHCGKPMDEDTPDPLAAKEAVTEAVT